MVDSESNGSGTACQCASVSSGNENGIIPGRVSNAPEISASELQLAVDIHDQLRERELCMPKFKASSQQLCFRRFLVDWLAVISQKLVLSHGVLHLAVVYLDLVMNRFEFSKESQLNLLALCCLWVAAKIEERDDKIPRLASLKPYLESACCQDDFLTMELVITQSLDWRLLVPTTVQFLDFYLQAGVDDDDSHAGFKVSRPDKAKVYLRKYANYFLEVTLQDHVFYDFLPSQVTAAIVAASRSCIRLSPVWPDRLSKLTRYALTDLQPAIDHLLKIHASDEERCRDEK